VITIYHVPRTRSARIIWLCEELGLDYEVVPVDFSPEYRRSAEWRRLNPIGKVPALTDLDAGGNRFTMIESGAMVHYILERTARVACSRLPVRRRARCSCSGPGSRRRALPGRWATWSTTAS